MAAFLYQKNFRSDEPPPEFATGPTIAHFPKKSRASHYLTNSTKARPAKRTWKMFFEAVGARFSWEKFNRISPQKELEMTGKLGAKQNRKPRTHTARFLRACRALTCI